MSYYVQIIGSDAQIPTGKLPTALEGASKFLRRPMDRTDGGVIGVLRSVGFDAGEGPDGVLIEGYNDKHLEDVDLLLIHLAPAIEGTLTWQGEDGSLYRDEFRDGKLFRNESVNVFGPPIEMTPEVVEAS